MEKKNVVCIKELFNNYILRNNVDEIMLHNDIAIYGTGKVGKICLELLEEFHLSENVIGFVDREESPMIDQNYLGYAVCRLDAIIKSANIILIASSYHEEIKSRILSFIEERGAENVKVIDMFETDCSNDSLLDYLSYVNYLHYDESADYVNKRITPYKRSDSDTKLIAWYLPQYYVTDYNSRFHGMGFTEWTNSSKAFPQFAGHYQPHIPYDVGYYDLTNPDSIRRQAELANYYGIYGFSIHYYWFDESTKMLQTPLKVLYENKDIDIHYCLNWATENWDMEWDDSFEKWDFQDSFIEQKLPNDVELFVEELIPYFKDERYIKIDGKPLFSIYNCNIFNKELFKTKIRKIRDEIRKYEFPDIYILISTGAGFFNEDALEWGADALVEYQPNMMDLCGNLERLYVSGYMNPYFKGYILDATDWIENKKYFFEHKTKNFFRCVSTAWDNTARKGKTAARIIWGITPEKMKNWLKDIMIESKRIHGREKDYVFISSWNEWAEGSHLEPDLHFGYAWLDAVRSALEECQNK